MQFFAQAIQQYFYIFNDGIAFGLISEGLLLGALDGMFQEIEESTNAGGLSLLNQSFTAATDQHRLHVGFCLRQIKQLSSVRIGPHLNNAFPGTVFHI